MKRRGLRLEVDEPSERQQRNRDRLASNPLRVAVVFAVLGGVAGLMLALGIDRSVLLLVPAGVLAGGVFGYGVSLEHRTTTPRGWRLAVYVAALAIALGAFAFFRLV